MNLLITLLSAVAALGPLIVFHEFGHYLVARLCGVKVLRFSLGFGKPLWSKRLGRDGTEWSISALPLGGYVKMLDGREGVVPEAESHRAFDRQNVWKRSAIVIAGPVANFILAIVLYWVMFVHGIPGIRPAVGEAPPATAAAAAQFQRGEIITHVAGVEVRTWQELRLALLEHAVEKRSITIETVGLNGNLYTRRLDLGGLQADALDADFLGILGLLPYRPPIPAIVEDVVAGSPAALAGLRRGDEIVAVDGKPVPLWEDLIKAIRSRPGATMELEYLRDGAPATLTITASDEVERGVHIGRIGVMPRQDPAAMKRLVTEVRYGPIDAIAAGVEKTWAMTSFSVEMMWKMVQGKVSLKNLSGPITIADYAGQSAQLGWLAFVSFVAVVSISLGVLNLLPVPLLDGGHLMYYAFEIIKGSPVSERTLELGQRVGMLLLMSLMAFAVYNDIQRLVGGS